MLSVGTFEPRKNQRMLVDAYEIYVKRVKSPVKLVMAGGSGWLMDDFQEYIVEKGLEKHILLPGYVSDEELGWLYKNCRANFYPSHYEGFGLPVLEGMSLGAATVCSNRTSLPEVIGDAGFVLSPDKVKDWADVMTVVTENEGKVIEYGNRQNSGHAISVGITVPNSF